MTPQKQANDNGRPITITARLRCTLEARARELTARRAASLTSFEKRELQSIRELLKITEVEE